MIEPMGMRGVREAVATEGGLAAAALAHQPQRLAALDLEAHTVDGLNVGHLALEDDPGGHREVHPDVVDADYRVAAGAGGGSLGCLLYNHAVSFYAGAGAPLAR